LRLFSYRFTASVKFVDKVLQEEIGPGPLNGHFDPPAGKKRHPQETGWRLGPGRGILN
jgi:hypothetical protein